MMDMPPVVEILVEQTMLVESVDGSHIKSTVPTPIKVNDECLQGVSSRFKIPFPILKAIKSVENGYAGHYRVNDNKTIDVGPFQINSVNFDKFNKFGITPYQLRWNGCVNAAAAGYLLRTHYDKAKNNGKLNNWDDFLKATATYHSGTNKFNFKYQEHLINAINRNWENKE